MADADTFAEFLRRVRAGDPEAARELVLQYEGIIRREVRLRLADPRLKRAFDSMDICQSVLASFFVRASAGQYDLEKPEDLLRLLVAMTRHKFNFQVRKQQAERRDYRRVVSGDLQTLEPIDAAAAPPGLQVADRELIQEIHKRMSDEELRLAGLRQQGMDWAEIAARLGGTPERRRKQLSRALDRVCRQLGIDEMNHA
jgi:RNA polymerase sigma-70 factor (ECF subfamily)